MVALFLKIGYVTRMAGKNHKYPSWVTKFREPGREVRYIRGRYYLYEISYRYDSTRKRSIKVTGKSLGTITKEGLVNPRSIRVKNIENICHCEYGISHFVLQCKDYLEKLKTSFANDWQQIVLLAYARFAFQSPLKRMKSHIERSWLAIELGVKDMSLKDANRLLQQLGERHKERIEYLRSFSTQSDCIIVDTTNMKTSASQSMFAKYGYNSEMSWESQASLLYIYSKKRIQPIYYRLLPGNIRDVKAFKISLKEAKIKDATVIADKGFFSESNVEELCSENLSFIIPLRRNNSYIDYSLLGANRLYFKYLDAYIWYKTITLPSKLSVTVFLNPSLKAQEEQDYLSRIDTHPEEYSIEQFEKKRSGFGTLAILTNTKLSPSDIYVTYKTRGQIEQTFDTLKNILHADRSYVHNDDTLQGWMFINHIALQWCYELQARIKKANLQTSISLEDATTALKEVRKVKLNNDWVLCEKTKSELDIIQALGV